MHSPRIKGGFLALALVVSCTEVTDDAAAEGLAEEIRIGGHDCVSGSFGKTKAPDGRYGLTSFVGLAGRSPTCGGSPTDGEWLYMAGRSRFGCGARLKVINPANGRYCVPAVADYGPNTCVEEAAGMPVVDVSPQVSEYLFGTRGARYTNNFKVLVETAGPDDVGCGHSGIPSATVSPIKLSWSVPASASDALSRHFEVEAPDSASVVQYAVAGHALGSVSRATAGDTFGFDFRFVEAQVGQRFEARAFSDKGVLVGLGVGVLDAVSGPAVFVRQSSAREFEIGVEGGSGIAAVSVKDGSTTLTDKVSGVTKSDRLAVKASFSSLGSHTFTVTSYDSTGKTVGAPAVRTVTLQRVASTDDPPDRTGPVNGRLGSVGAGEDGVDPEMEHLASTAPTSTVGGRCPDGTSPGVGYLIGARTTVCNVTVDGFPVEHKTAQRFLAMREAAAGSGIALRLNFGWRDNDTQTALYTRNCRHGVCNPTTALPGYSYHQSGLALDISVGPVTTPTYKWMKVHARDFGFCRTVPSEPWHWEQEGQDRCIPL